MNAVRLIPVLALSLSSLSLAQVVPTTPTGFTSRKIGDATGSSSGASLSAPTPPSATTVRHISYVALSDPRQWTSSDGKPLLAKLIAWEQSEQVITQGQPAPEPTLPEMPNGPTVIRDDKVRLLVNSKPFELPLSRLSDADQDFIADVVAAVTLNAQTQPTPKDAGTEATPD